MNYLKTYSEAKEKVWRLVDTGFFHIFGSNVLNKIFAFCSSVFIVRLISKYEYGVYNVALNRLSFFLIIAGLGMISATLQLCSEKANDKAESLIIYKYGSAIGNKFNIFLGFLILISSFFIPNSIDGANELLLLLAFIPFCEGINEFQKVFFRSTLDNKSYAYSNSIGAFLVVLFSVIGAFIYNVKGLIIGRYLAAILTTLITKIKLNGPISITGTKECIIEKAIFFKIAITSMMNNGISELLYLFDILLISEILEAAEAVADYKIAIVIPSALIFIPSSICIYIYPYFSLNKDNKRWLEKNFKLLMLALGFFNACVTFFLIAFAPQIISIIFGEQYLSAITMFRLSSLNYFFMGTFRIIAGNLLVTQRKLRFNLIASIVAGLLNLISNYYFINLIGSIGAVLTTLMISALSGIVYTAYYVYIIKSKPIITNE